MECCPKGRALWEHLKHHSDQLEFYQGCKIRRLGSRQALVFPLRRKPAGPARAQKKKKKKENAARPRSRPRRQSRA
jgi:hypothetical protein